MLHKIREDIAEILRNAGVTGDIDLSIPPKEDMGDFAFACFDLAKEKGENPAIVASKIKSEIENLKSPKSSALGQAEIIDHVESFGPYVNFFLKSFVIAEIVLDGIDGAGEKYGAHDAGKGKKIMVEFAHPNTHKAFHIGHLRNITTGESIVRLLENMGHTIIRANYQGDVGMHIAKSLWGIHQMWDEYLSIKVEAITERVAFLGKAYAFGSQSFESEDTKSKEAIIAVNDQIYSRDPAILELYTETRQWSLEYFNSIYKRVDSQFDRLYFESEVFERGVEIVREHLKKGVFDSSQGAIIFPGSKYGLHDRVFINSKGFPTYEAKDLALAEVQFKEFHPDSIIHVVAKEQTEYFKVMFRALEDVLPESKGREHHLVYGWVDLKEGKMSSRTGQVVLAEWLLDEVGKAVGDERVALSAVKYAFLKTGVENNISFDLKESVSLVGNSGPYLLYIVARINSIMRKFGTITHVSLPTNNDQLPISSPEKQLLLKLAAFPEVTQFAADTLDPSQVAKYLFELAQTFNSFYNTCPVLQSEGVVQNFRLRLISAVQMVMTHGLYLLGIATVEEM